MQRGNTTAIVIILAVILIGGGYWLSRNSQKAPIPSEEASDTESSVLDLSSDSEESGQIGKDTEQAQQNETDLSFVGRVLAGDTSPLLDFERSDYEKALASDKLIVLYFYANWCPICREETQSSLYPAFNELSGDDVIGFRVNYKDSDTDEYEKQLAKEFGVAYQHTKVFVKNGERILKAPDSWTKDRYLEEISKY